MSCQPADEPGKNFQRRTGLDKAPGAAVAVGRQRSLGGQLAHAVSSSAMTIIVVLIALIWSVPTFGFFSLRSALLRTSTLWMVDRFVSSLALHHPELPARASVAEHRAGLSQQPVHCHSWHHPAGADRGLCGLCLCLDEVSWAGLDLSDIVALLVVPVQTTLIPVLNLFTDVYKSTGSADRQLCRRLAGAYGATVCRSPSICCATFSARCPRTSLNRPASMARRTCASSSPF